MRGGNEEKGDLPSKADGFLKSDGLSKRPVTKARWREQSSRSDEFSLMINNDEIEENKEGSEVYIG